MSSETLISHFKSSNSPLNSSKPLHLPSTKPSPPPPHPDHPNHLQSMLPTTAKSSKWLHRLRTSRGFPDSDHIDLEHFLSTSIDPTDKPPTPEDNLVSQSFDCNGAVQLQGRDLINNVLSDLFHMGEFDDTSRIKKKRCYRKQTCPKICVVSTDLNVENVRKVRRKVKEVSQVVEEGEEKGEWDVSGYSQTEVTVIDTSVPCWKFEKVLYRNKNVWKVEDRKGLGLGLVSGDMKKGKERLNENDVRKKKLKKKMKLSGSLKCVDKDESKFDHGKKQVDEASSSVILIKSIPTTNKKNVSSVKSMR